MLDLVDREGDEEALELAKRFFWHDFRGQPRKWTWRSWRTRRLLQGGTVRPSHFLREHKGELVVIGAVTFLQRSTVFLITGMVYLGFGLSGSSLFHIWSVQAAVYIAVDMLPVPGAQGITELMYAAVFGGVFGAQYVKASMVLVRGMDFYVPFCVSMLIVLAGHGVSYVRRQRKRA